MGLHIPMEAYVSVRKKIVFRGVAAVLGLLVGVIVASLVVFQRDWDKRREAADLSHVNLALLVRAMEIVPVADGCVQDPLGFDQPAELPSGPPAEAVVMARWRLEESRTLCQASAVWIMNSAEEAHRMWAIQKAEWGADVLPDQIDPAADTELARRLKPVCLSGYAENPCGAAVVMRVGRLVIWSMAFAETESLADTQLRLWFWNFLGFLQINQDVASGA